MKTFMGPQGVSIENTEVVSWVSVWTPLPKGSLLNPDCPARGQTPEMGWKKNPVKHTLSRAPAVWTWECSFWSHENSCSSIQLNAEQPNGACKPAYRYTHTSWWRQWSMQTCIQTHPYFLMETTEHPSLHTVTPILCEGGNSWGERGLVWVVKASVLRVLREVLDLPRLYLPQNKIVQKTHRRPWHLRYKREKRWNSLFAVNIYKNNFMIPKCSGELHYEKWVFIAIFSWKCVSDA